MFASRLISTSFLSNFSNSSRGSLFAFLFFGVLLFFSAAVSFLAYLLFLACGIELVFEFEENFIISLVRFEIWG